MRCTMLDDVLFEYADHFGDNFPVFMMLGRPDEEIIEIVQKCLRDGTPYKPNTEANAFDR